MGLFLHPCEGEMVCARSPAQPKIPYFNAPIYLENKTQIGKLDEILGPMHELFFTVKLDNGVVASSFKPNDKVYIASDKLLPLERFISKPKPAGGNRTFYFIMVYLFSLYSIKTFRITRKSSKTFKRWSRRRTRCS